MALEINDRRKLAEKPENVIPVLVTRIEGGAMYKFSDFAASLYSDSIKAKEHPEEAKQKRFLAEKAEKERLEQEAGKKKEAKKLEGQISTLKQNEDFFKLINILQNGTPKGKANAATALQDLARNNADSRVKIAQAGGIAPLIALLSSGDAAGKEQAAGALWNLGVNDDNKVKIVQAGGIAPLIALLTSGDAAGRTSAVLALKNLTYHDSGKSTIRSTGLQAIQNAVNNETDADAKAAIQKLLDSL